MTVINLDEHRDRPDGGGYDGSVCPCGEAWYVLRGESAAVCVARDGSITGYGGSLFCVSCGRPWSPSPQPG